MQSSRSFRCAQQYSNMTWNEGQGKTPRARACDNARANLLPLSFAARNCSRRRLDGRKAESGGACDPGIFSIARANQRNFLAARIDRPRGKPLANAAEPLGHQFSHSAAKNDYIGFEHVHDVAKPDREQISRLL